MNLYLDDLRTTPEGFERVYSYEEFVAYLQHYGVPDFISFDTTIWARSFRAMIVPNIWWIIV